jgi:perosamine synthetase
MSKTIPLSIPVFSGREWRLVKDCIDTAWVSTAGRYVGQFEEDICRYTGTRHAVACMNGTAGLHIAALLAGIGAGDEALVPALTFIAPVNAVRYVSAEPVFMDCDRYMNIDPEKLEDFCKKECALTGRGLKNKRTGRLIKAVIVVHVFGNPCDMGSIMRIARRYTLKVIEDATESIGSYYVRGRYAARHTGTIGDIGVYSFNGNKIITTGGGGMIVTSNPKLAERARYLTTQAKDDAVRYIHNGIGYNFRLTNLQAALGVAQLEQLEKFIRVKKANYLRYKKGCEPIEGVSLLGVPDGTRPNYWFYSLLIDKKRFGIGREALMARLAARGIQARPLWYLNHRQKPYAKNQSYRIERAVWFWQRVLNLPCSSDLTAAQVAFIVDSIKRAKGKSHG